MLDADTQALLATTRITIDLDALAANWRKLAALAPAAAAGAALKADAYGLGAPRAAAALLKAGCRHFFVATPAEGLELREAVPSAEIFVLGGVTRDAIPFLIEAGLTPVLNDASEIAIWADWCRLAGFRRPCALHVDTGMNRLGLRPDEAIALAGDPDRINSITPVLVMSHLACADQPGHDMNARQLARFREVAAHFAGVRASLANSAGIFLGPEYHFDITRPGISLYGGEAVGKVVNEMAPVVGFEGRILQVRRAAKGEIVGYGATVELQRDSLVAVVGAGYADGVLRAASGSGVPMRRLDAAASGWLAGHKVPVIGRISMDLTTYDVTDVPPTTLEKAKWIEFFGRNAALDDFARAAGTIGYEVLTRIGARASRVYTGG